MKRISQAITATLTGLAVMFGLVAVGTPAAVAATPTNYVTKAEYNKVRKGMDIKRVHRIFDVNGKQVLYFRAEPNIGLPASQSRGYRVKSQWGFVWVDYDKINGTWKVADKDAYWGGVADTPNYVSKGEFKKVHKGMKMAHVHNIFDIKGKQTSYASGERGWWPATQTREYRTKSKWGSVEIDYKKVKGAWRVDSKYAYWG